MSDRQCSSCGGFCGRGGCKRENVKVNKQREALKLALEVLEEINKLSIGENAICLPAEIDSAVSAIREALTEPEQKPWGWIVWRAMAEPEVERCKPKDGDYVLCDPLYTAPPTRKSLSSEELQSIPEYQKLLRELGPVWAPMLRYFCEAIERAHGIGSD